MLDEVEKSGEFEIESEPRPLLAGAACS